MTSQPPSAQPPAAAAVPTCYRHPGRETYVRCQRCDRPICPDCMRDAAVGHQCVECVKEGNRTVRQQRTTFGGRISAIPWVTRALLTINVVAFAAQYLEPMVTRRFEMWTFGVESGQWWRLITGAFLHGGILHIALNMWALLVLGPTIERHLGALRFTVLYLLSALGGSVAVYLLADAAVGASGAIYGLFAAIFIIGRRLGYDMRAIVPILVINLAINFLPFISWQGHLGGLITGAIVSAAMAYAPPKHRAVIQLGAAAAVFVVLVLLVVLIQPSGGP